MRVLLAAAALFVAASSCAAKGTLRTVTLRVTPGSMGGPSTCTKSSPTGAAYVCPSLPAALNVAATLEGAATTVIFADTFVAREPLRLRSAAAPAATLRLQGTGTGATIDGGGASALLQVSGGGAVSVDSVGFRRGYVSFAKDTKGYAPVSVGFPSPMPQPTTFTNCSFHDNTGAYGGAAALHHGVTVFEGCSFLNSSSFGDGCSDGERTFPLRPVRYYLSV